ncbi:hypothetical protein QCA50_007546 [Cerrena zonata]|uniref:Uncharacterized protein n=1 Tax=Cerrena zonata TaxID=2478898 RepID=A0AAW0GFY1_9APHY
MSSADTGSKKQKDKSKRKSTSQPSVVITPHGKNEGTNTDWEYKPPPGAALVNHAVDAGEFDYESLKGQEEHLEMWIIRVPDTVRPKALSNLSLDVPSGSKTSKVGSLERKHASYDVWYLGDDTNDAVGGEEVKNLSVLVPRAKKGGKLYAAPKLPTRHFVLSARPPLPTPDPSSESSSQDSLTIQHKNPPRPTYPKEVLKHRFVPFGSLYCEGVEQMEVDEEPSLPKGSKPPADTHPESGGKPKKRKTETAEDSSEPRKSRKSKGTSS